MQVDTLIGVLWYINIR